MPARRSNLVQSSESLLLRRGMRPAARVLAFVVVSAIIVQSLALMAALFGVRISATLSEVLQPALTIALLFAGLHIFSLAPITDRLAKSEVAIRRLRFHKHKLEREVLEGDAALAETRKTLQTETALRVQTESEMQKLSRDLEQQFSVRSGALQSQNVELSQKVTELESASAIISQKAAQFRRLAELASEGMWMLDISGQTTFINPHGAELLGYPRSEILGRPAEELIVRASLPPNFQGFNLRHGSTPDAFDCRLRRKDGSETSARASICSMINDEGDYLGALILFVGLPPMANQVRSIPPRGNGASPGGGSPEPAADRLESARRLAIGLAQELNHALGPVLLSAGLLRARSPRYTHHLISAIEEGIGRSASVLKDALVFAQGIELDRAVVQPSELLKSLAGAFQQIVAPTVHIRCEVPENIWDMQADTTQLKHALWRLCVNAGKAIASGGHLTLRAHNLASERSPGDVGASLQPGPYVVLEVHDTGPTIPTQALARMFEPFFACPERGQEPGLSLSIVSAIMQSHGGAARVRRATAEGTVFALFVPAVRGIENESIHQTAAHLQGNGEWILLVEEDPETCTNASRILEQNGYHVLIADDGFEAVGELAERVGQIRAVLTNILMAPMDGPALARAARRIDPQIRVIAISSSSGILAQADKLAALQTLGIHRLLAKPYTPEDLLHALHAELHRPPL